MINVSVDTQFFAKYYHRGKLGKSNMGFSCIISYNCKIKGLIKKKKRRRRKYVPVLNKFLFRE